MAQHLVGNMQGTVDKRRANAGSAAIQTGSVTNAQTYDSPSDIEAALATADAAYYTAARLNRLTLNDKIYALRLANDAAGVG